MTPEESRGYILKLSLRGRCLRNEVHQPHLLIQEEPQRESAETETVKENPWEFLVIQWDFIVIEWDFIVI